MNPEYEVNQEDIEKIKNWWWRFGMTDYIPIQIQDTEQINFYGPIYMNTHRHWYMYRQDARKLFPERTF